MSLKEDLNEAVATVKAYRGTPLYHAFITLLDAIDETHREELVTAQLDRVQHVQGAAAQTRALRRALVAAGPNISPIG